MREPSTATTWRSRRKRTVQTTEISPQGYEERTSLTWPSGRSAAGNTPLTPMAIEVRCSDWRPVSESPWWPGADELHRRGRIYDCSRSPHQQRSNLIPLDGREESIYGC